MSEEQLESTENPPELPSAIDVSGKEISTLPVRNILEIQYHRMIFNEIGQSFVSIEKNITPPSGWQLVSVSVSSWDLSYGHRSYERALVSHMAASASVKLSGRSLKVTATALIREPTSAPRRRWKGYVDVQAIFTG